MELNKKMEKYLNKLAKTNENQIAFGLTLGLSVEGLTVRVALAMIHDFIYENFEGVELKEPTDKQIKFGEKFGVDFSNMSKNVAFAYITDILEALNLKSIEEQNIKHGDHVINKHDKAKTVHVISSISKDGHLYFKKDNENKCCKGAARYMIKINKNLIYDIFKKYREVEMV